MTLHLDEAGRGAPQDWIGWSCSYCSGPLEPRPHGLYCPGEGRFFACLDGVHRLLSEERRRELQPLLELHQRLRREDGPGPEAPPQRPRPDASRRRARAFEQGLQAVRRELGPGPWRVLDVGAGPCRDSLRLLEQGHRVVAVDPSLDPEDGLRAAGSDLLPRAEAEMEALPMAPGRFDLVLASGVVHWSPRLTRVLVELRRVTRAGGCLLILETPTYRRREDGEAMVAQRMREQARRFGLVLAREHQAGYLVLEEVGEVFRSCGWEARVRGWPGRLAELAGDALEVARWGRRTARLPWILARREG